MTRILIQQQLDKTYHVWTEGQKAGSIDDIRFAKWYLNAYAEAMTIRDEIGGDIVELESLYIKDQLIKEGKYGGV